jgi:hypothetical protein
MKPSVPAASNAFDIFTQKGTGNSEHFDFAMRDMNYKVFKRAVGK